MDRFAWFEGQAKEAGGRWSRSSATRKPFRCPTCKRKHSGFIGLGKNGKLYQFKTYRHGRISERTKLNAKANNPNLVTYAGNTYDWKRSYGYVEILKCVDPYHNSLWGDRRSGEPESIPDGWRKMNKEDHEAVKLRAQKTKKRNRKRQGKSKR